MLVCIKSVINDVTASVFILTFFLAAVFILLVCHIKRKLRFFFLQVLQVHEQLERPRDPVGTEDLGDTEKAIVREMCNVSKLCISRSQSVLSFCACVSVRFCA